MHNLELQPTSQEIWETKYQLKDEHQSPVDQTIADTNTRVAKALASIEPKDQDYWFEKFKWAIDMGATPAGRIMSNAGAEKYKPATSLINCTVSQIVEDSMHGVLDANLQAGLTLKAGCGIGYEFSTLRPKGAFVSGAGAYTSGPLTFMDIFDSMCFTVSSAGGRRGAQMGTFAVWHPDVEAFIAAKREDGRLRQFNLSLLIDDDFMEAVKANDDYHLVFPVKQSEIDRGLVKGELIKKKRFWDSSYCTKMGYIVDEDDMILCQVYKTIPAHDLWHTIMKSTYDYAEPGFLLIDRINQENNNWFNEEIRATNPCLHPDTLIETVEGRVRIEDIKEPTIVYTSMPDGSLGMARSSASWISKKDASVMRIRTRNGKEIKVTPEHKVLVHDRGWIEAQNLELGDRVVQLCRARRGAAYSGVKLTTEGNREYKMEHRLIAEAVYGDLGDNVVHHINNNTYENHIDNFEVLSEEEHNRLTASTTHPQSHQVHGEGGRFVGNGVQPKKIVPMPEHLKSNMKNNYSNAVVDIEFDFETVDVYDMTVEGTHNMIGNFMVVHNCGEQPLPPEGSCLLGSVNVAKMVKNPFTEHAEFDWETYKEVVRVFTRMLDNVVELNGLPLAGQRREIEYKRRHGMGFLGLGSALSLLGKEYGDEYSIAFTEEIMKVMAIEGIKEGINLAIEKGPAPVFLDETDGVSNKEHWVNGNYMRRIWEASPELKERALEHGCRFTHHTSIAPTGTISLSLNNNASNGIEPSFAHHYVRNVVTAGKKSKASVDVYSYEMLLYKEITGNEEVPETFSTSENVPIFAHVDIQAAAQKWCDSSISKTINVPTDTPFDEFQQIYLYAYEKGLKGATTFRFNPDAFQGVLVTEDNLKNTMYQFTLEDGTVFEGTGDEGVIYDGEEHTIANLYDAIKENYYGKF